VSLWRRGAAHQAAQTRTSWPFAGMPLIPGRIGGASGVVPITAETALAHSAVWGCLRLRADLVSTMPLEVFRTVGDLDVKLPPPLVLSLPGGERCNINEWMWSSQHDLDKVGNAVGIITAVDGYGLPARIELQAHDTVTVVVRKGKLAGYRIAGKFYEPPEIWHEKQYTQSGMFVGLSPIANAALSVSQGLSASQFALDWFQAGGVPAGRLKNVARTIDPAEAAVVKRAFKSAVANRDLFVHGMDWDYEFIQADRNAAEWIESNRASVLDVCRFLGTPSDLIDGETQSRGSIKYQNITQRILELLVINMQPVLVRRERALSALLPQARKARFNTAALLRMDPAVLAATWQVEINSRTRTPDEVRALMGLPPLTADQIDQFATLFGAGGMSDPGVLSGAQPSA